MTQQFSKGDKVTVREGARSLQGIRPDPDEVRTVMDTDPEEAYDVLLSESVHGYKGRWFKAEDLVPYVESPAPLDLAKVKAGDKVTLGSDELVANIAARVTATTEEPTT